MTGQPNYDARSDRPSRLGQAAAWVGIIAGVVFIVAVILFSGFFLGLSSGGPYSWHRGSNVGRDVSCPMMGSGGMMGPGGGMMGPGGMGPGGPTGPQQTPSTTAPTMPRP